MVPRAATPTAAEAGGGSTAGLGRPPRKPRGRDKRANRVGQALGAIDGQPAGVPGDRLAGRQGLLWPWRLRGGCRAVRAPLGLTDGGELSHAPDVGPPQEPGLAVVDVLHLDDKFRLGLQQLVGLAVPRLSPQRVEGFPLAIEALRGMNVPRQLIDQEDGAGTLPGDGVLDGAVALIGVRVNLGETGAGQVQGVQLQLGPGRGGLLTTVPAPFAAREKTGRTSPCQPSSSIVGPAIRAC